MKDDDLIEYAYLNMDTLVLYADGVALAESIRDNPRINEVHAFPDWSIGCVLYAVGTGEITEAKAYHAFKKAVDKLEPRVLH